MVPTATIEKQESGREELLALAESGQRQQLRLVLNDLHPADLAIHLSEMDPINRLACFRLLDLDHASEVLAELESDIQTDLLRKLGAIGIAPIISRMSPDDACDLLSELPEEKANAIINQLPDKDAKEDLEELLSFDHDTAGGIMSTDYLSIVSSMSVGEALIRLREMYEDLEEDLYDIYVIDESEILVGHVTVKDLLTENPVSPVEAVMDDNFVSVRTEDDQEEVAEKLGRYDLLSVPVIDDTGKLRGIITADDIIDVIQEEATEDIYQSSGISASSGEVQEQLGYNIGKAFGARLPWLIATLLIESGSAGVITHFDSVIRDTVAAASFMPLLSGVTGSVATQSTCIIIRSTRERHINIKLIARNLFHEIKVGLLLAALCGSSTFFLSLVLHHAHRELGLLVAISLIITMTVGVAIGTLMPMLFQRLRIDPAHASGPFITSLLDVSTMSIYLTIVHFFRANLI